MKRSSTATMIERIIDMVATLRANPMSRAELATRWGVTPRQASNVISRAQQWFNIELRYEADYGYRIIDMGLLSPSRLPRTEVSR